MKNYYFYIFTILLQTFTSCSINKELKDEREAWNFNNWDKEFKSRAFCLCQLKGYENKNIEKKLWDNDRSYYNALAIAIFDDSLEFQVKKEINLIRLDSINSEGTYPEDLKPLYQKRNVLNHCLEFYGSKRLDSLTRMQQKYWESIPNIMNKIHEKIPTY
ncbi:hypothetical protein G6R40_02645 [Chryseobacterium sp. POL2]|uniref:hypothetical protein n=1 Tax=Chryseobacterium sp. POL2 TaxID=2713414 RepID=UPI0013E0FC59|nr:hypothetical protein [Chryseobacterium sp. POL2]QIG88629.1 hypothetical protein G6R40_02645 [Chryseobacterium sp. POL2]